MRSPATTVDFGGSATENQLAAEVGPDSEASERRDSRVRGSTLHLLGPFGGAATLAIVLLSWRFTFTAPGLRATVETLLVLSPLLSAAWICAKLKQTQSLSDLLTFAGLMLLTAQEFVLFAAPSIFGFRPASPSGPASLTIQLLLATLFVTASRSPRRRLAAPRRAALVLSGLVTVCAAACAFLGGLIDGPSNASAHATHVPTLALTIPAITLLVAAAAGFARHAVRDRRDVVAGLLGAASTLLAAVWTYDLLSPQVPPEAISGRECLRAGALGLILLIALSSYRRTRHIELELAVARERHRIVRDLHDGIAQDLAFIASHGEYLAVDLGVDHPLTVAARRALAVSRGFIADLSASDTPTMAAALQAVARELSGRYGVQITVEANGEDLPADKREDVVRIAREAIVNGIKHGGASRIEVILDTKVGAFTLTIRDNGRGMPDRRCTPRDGYGLRAMDERSRALGATLKMRQSATGGTDVELIVP